MNIQRTRCLAVPLLALLALTACRSSGTVAQETDDPSRLVLTEVERTQALGLAAAVRPQIDKATPRIPNAVVTKEIVTAVGVYPPTDETDTRRLASVISFDYSTGAAIRVVVDLADGSTVDSRELPGSSAPLAPEELDRAKELLARDSEAYRALLEAPAANYDLGTFVSSGDEGGDLARHRLLMIRPVYFGSAPKAPIAILDLTMDTIVRYEN